MTGTGGAAATDKNMLRQRARARRAAAAAADAGRAEEDCAAMRAAAHGACLPLPAAAVVAGYWPIGDELDPRRLLIALRARGHPIALPVVVAPDMGLIFRRWDSEAAPPAGAFGIPAPDPTAPEIRPDVLIVPLVAFDRTGNRLGRGAGYYDRTLASLRQAVPARKEAGTGGAKGTVLAVGFAYGAQEVDAIPVTAGDETLDWIVTEEEVFATAGERARGAEAGETAE